MSASSRFDAGRPVDHARSPQGTPTLSYGGDYNPEQWPETVWSDDVALMRRAGVNLVTVGVFSWARLEPEPGRFTVDWLDRLLTLLADAGIDVDLATPTASPPPWMSVRWPDALSVDADGVRTSHGSRNHFCPSAPSYRDRCRIIATALVERYAHHPAVVMWHVGNEYGQVCFCDHCAAAFRIWLQDLYGDLAHLNEAWGTAFWSQSYGAWEEVLPPRAAPYLRNPGHELDYRRFTSDAQLACYRDQREIIRAADPSVPVTTNFMGAFPGVDYRGWAPYVDVIADDSYPDPTDPDSPIGSAFTADLMRSLAAGKPWLLLEQAAGAVSWREVNVAKTPARVRLDSWQAIARGAVGSCYFQWRASRAGAERFHAALVPHHGTETAVFRGVEEHGRELAALASDPSFWAARSSATSGDGQVALVLDWDCWWASLAPDLPSARLDLLAETKRWYAALWRRGLRVDIVGSEDDLSGYAVVCCPWQLLLTDRARERLRSAVAAGAHLVLGPFSGILDATARVQPGPFPAGLTDLVGAQVIEWLPVADGDTVRLNDEPGALADARGSFWVDRLQVADAEVLAVVVDGQAAGHPAVVRRRVGTGEGAVTYLATRPDAETLDRILGEVVDGAGVVGPVPAPPSGIEVATHGDLVTLLHRGGRECIVPTGALTDLHTAERPGEVRLPSDEIRHLVRARAHDQHDQPTNDREKPVTRRESRR
ncbi:MAG TPA: beta-galactosidase [Microlunatus sp.]